MGTSKICYADSDGDGYGGKTSPQSVCGSCPSGTVTNNMDCYDSSADVHPGQSNYFETGYGAGNFDYDCNGREEKQALSPPSVQVQGVCMCNSSTGECSAPTSVPTPCGGRGTACVGGGNGTCVDCYSTPSWTIQGCR